MTTPCTLSTLVERWPLATPFHVSGHTVEAASVLVVSLRSGQHEGRGEAAGVYYRGETPDGMADQIAAVRPDIERGISREDLIALMPAGGARNAVDAALWSLTAQRRGTTVAQLAGRPRLRPLRTSFTVGVDTVEAMAEAARGYEDALALKIKLDGSPLDADRLLAIRAARPGVELSVDANQGWTQDHMIRMLPVMQHVGVELLEQPLPVGEDVCLESMSYPIRLAADESFQDLDDLATVARRYHVVNVKLDKCGGLTRALSLITPIRDLGLSVMVGCMPCTSLGVAPAYVLGQLSDRVDLDGPCFLAEDRTPSFQYRNGYLLGPASPWGSDETHHEAN
ncbi:dipeptide epimerase [Pandoraea fibrosis]|uniref:Dipeptide epimerase n=1 Tax=Pandoraea fibrosis TaxID=1891094 RepID=A0ABX6HMC4_9BURK|nr:dipeptide epimerase [Pandoraea fibrosis]QHE91191.1 dipeptide epimerase [Pandoraea fibrosis]QHF12022.1 dipeptide epimerase [Pandoraea fibrosis]